MNESAEQMNNGHWTPVTNFVLINQTSCFCIYINDLLHLLIHFDLRQMINP